MNFSDANLLSLRKVDQYDFSPVFGFLLYLLVDSTSGSFTYVITLWIDNLLETIKNR